jgi:hypothetical protein
MTPSQVMQGERNFYWNLSGGGTIEKMRLASYSAEL